LEPDDIEQRSIRQGFTAEASQCPGTGEMVARRDNNVIINANLGITINV
jgi:hypothetical protein